jgi:hypothetical protein
MDFESSNIMSRSCMQFLMCVVVVLCFGVIADPVSAWTDIEEVGNWYPSPNGISERTPYKGDFVMNVGELHVNISNFGLIGSKAGSICSYCDVPSAQWPAGSGVEYLWAAGLWVGGVMLGEKLVSTGMYDAEIRSRPGTEEVIYEAISGRITFPEGNDLAGGKRLPESGADDDDDDFIDEETLDGYDNDEDGFIDEDFGQVGNQMMVCTQYDNTRLASEYYSDHTPLNLKIVQSSYAWENDDADDFVGFDFKITNIGVASISDVYLGFFADSDIGKVNRPGRADDDLAGSFDGMVMAKDGSFVPVSVGYMYDKDGDGGEATGFFGIIFLGHDVDPTGLRAPQSVKLRSYQAFSGQSAFDQGGDPTNDAERYELLSADERDPNTNEAKENDFRFMVSAGPFKELEPDNSLNFQAGLVVGEGLEGLKANAAEAALTFYGNFFNIDNNVETGVQGRETRVCLSDYASSGGQNPIYTFRADYMDTTCVTQEFVLSQPMIEADDLYFDTEANDQCVYVNMDNCFECARQNGERCTGSNDLIQTWDCKDPEDVTPDADKAAGCTGVSGNEFQISWLVGMAPPPPGMRLWPTDAAVHVYWDNVSEITPDIRQNKIDFESYRIWRADNWDRPFGSSIENGPESNLWQLLNEYDIANYYYNERIFQSGGLDTTVIDTLPLGRNTGLEAISYRPRCLDDLQYYGLKDAMQTVIDADSLGLMSKRPSLLDRFGSVVPGFEGLLPWQGYPAILDTFFMCAGREKTSITTSSKEPVQFYEYIDSDIHNGFLYFYSVTASDHAIDIDGDDVTVIGSGLVGDPGSSFSSTSPGTSAQSAEDRARYGANIYVYPNPATRDALEEFQELSPNADDPTGVRVKFANLPQADNTIRIFSLNGDLIQTIEHDGTGGFGEAEWNLVSRNGQEVVSGIYLYSVISAGESFDDFIGKFVVIR